MKTVKFSLLLLTLPLCCGLNAAESTTKLLAIYLATGPVDWSSVAGDTARLDAVKLEAEPILADQDFVSYSITNYTFMYGNDVSKLGPQELARITNLTYHTFAITFKAAKRLSSALHGLPVTEENMFGFAGPDTTFVLKALGEPVYVGVFSCPLSSALYGVPTVYPENLFPVASTTTTNVAFWMVQNPPPKLKDKRNDPRVLDALRQLRLR